MATAAKNHGELRSGVLATLLAALSSALMGAVFFGAHRSDPEFDSLAGSFIRVLANCTLLIWLCRRQGSGGLPRIHRIRGHAELWGWALFGALTVCSFFGALSLLGNGLTALLSATSGLFVSALAAAITGQKVRMRDWVGVGGALAGTALLFVPFSSFPANALGYFLGLSSGLFAALAYLMVARARQRYSTATIMLHWCVLAFALHLLLFTVREVQWPAHALAWALLAVAGLLAGLAQHFSAIAYQMAPAVVVVSLSYATPVLSTLLDNWIFGLPLNPWNWAGVALVLAFGAVLPLSSLIAPRDSETTNCIALPRGG